VTGRQELSVIRDWLLGEEKEEAAFSFALLKLKT
jgi:hypothetical protein